MGSGLARPALAMLSVLLAFLQVAVAAPVVPSALERIRQLRAQGEIAEALAVAQQARTAAPLDVDLALFEGLLRFQTGDAAGAARVLAEALALAPDYPDVRLALARALQALGQEAQALDVLAPLEATVSLEALLLIARLALATAEPERAKAALARAQALSRAHPRAPAVAGTSDNEGQLALASITFDRLLEASGPPIEAARRDRQDRAGESPRYSLSVAGTASRFRGGAGDPWFDFDLALAWKASAHETVRVELSERRRFGAEDTIFGLGLDVDLHGTAFTTMVRATPAADFSPHLELRFGAERPLSRSRGLIAGTAVRFDLRLARYRQGTVAGIAPGITQYFADGTVWATLSLGINRDEAGRFDQTLSGRFDWLAGTRTRLFLGSAFARDGTAHGTIGERTLFAGVLYDLNESVQLFVDLAQVGRRKAPDRTAFGLGVRIRF
jgi:YaiO family outer membrane protein